AGGAGDPEGAEEVRHVGGGQRHRVGGLGGPRPAHPRLARGAAPGQGVGLRGGTAAAGVPAAGRVPFLKGLAHPAAGDLGASTGGGGGDGRLTPAAGAGWGGGDALTNSRPQASSALLKSSTNWLRSWFKASRSSGSMSGLAAASSNH